MNIVELRSITRTLPAICVVLCAIAAPLVAIYVTPDVETVPLERVVANLERLIRAEPKDVELRVNLARLHSMAYASNVTEVQALRSGFVGIPGWSQGQPFFGHDAEHRQLPIKASADAVVAARAKVHLTRAVEAYRAALALAPQGGAATLDRRLADLGTRGRWITPIAVPLRAGVSAGDMIDVQRTHTRLRGLCAGRYSPMARCGPPSTG